MNCLCCDLQASCGLVGSNENLLLLARPLDNMVNMVKPRFKDAKQHSTQLAWLKRCEDQEKGTLCEQESCKTKRLSKPALYFDYDTLDGLQVGRLLECASKMC